MKRNQAVRLAMTYPFSQTKSMAGDKHRRVAWASFSIETTLNGGLYRSAAASSEFCGYASMANDHNRVAWATKSF